MNVYHIERNAAADYEEVAEVVVVANTERDARELFAREEIPSRGPGYEGPEVWLDRDLTRATRLGPALDPTPRIVVRHYTGG